MNSRTMRAVVIDSYNGVKGVRVADVPVIAPGEGEVRIAVTAASIGPWDIFTTRGAFAELLGEDENRTSFPMVLGWDLAGVVEEAGAGADLAPGTRVLAMSRQPLNGIGVHAEQATVPAGLCVPIPDGVDDVHASIIPCCALTAWLALDEARLDPGGDTLLVIGATGQLGGFVTQLAASRGHTVIASVAPDAADEARALGATHVIDRGGNLAQQVHAFLPDGVSVAFDPVGGAVTAAASVAIREGGRYVTSVSWAGSVDERDISFRLLFVEENRDALRELAAMLADGRISARIGEVVPLDDARLAYEAVAAGGLTGKVVLDPHA